MTLIRILILSIIVAINAFSMVAGGIGFKGAQEFNIYGE